MPDACVNPAIATQVSAMIGESLAAWVKGTPVVAFSIDYRLAKPTGNESPAPLDDVQRAVRLIWDAKAAPGEREVSVRETRQGRGSGREGAVRGIGNPGTPRRPIDSWPCAR